MGPFKATDSNCLYFWYNANRHNCRHFWDFVVSMIFAFWIFFWVFGSLQTSLLCIVGELAWDQLWGRSWENILEGVCRIICITKPPDQSFQCPSLELSKVVVSHFDYPEYKKKYIHMLLKLPRTKWIFFRGQ